MVIARWNGTVIAESHKTIIVEGNHYFPPEAVKTQYLKSSDTTSRCTWKGVANYYSFVVDGKLNEDAAWYRAGTDGDVLATHLQEEGATSFARSCNAPIERITSKRRVERRFGPSRGTGHSWKKIQ